MENQRKQQCANPSKTARDADWVVVNKDGHWGKEDFDLIDAEEAQCWCGGVDAEKCLQKGHKWPLCSIEQGHLWPRDASNAHYKTGKETDETRSTGSTSGASSCEQSSSDDSDRSSGDLTPGRADLSPEVYEGGPFTSLAILTELLDKGWYSGPDPHDASAETEPRDGTERPSPETKREDTCTKAEHGRRE